jgi:hypothetical protein
VKNWDIFISHASEDKATVARPLADALRKAGARVWLDDHELTVGDSLTEKIDEGLSRSQFGVVVISPAFLAKRWPRRELAGLRAREEDGAKIVLPVWHSVDKPTVAQFSPILADVLAADTSRGIDAVVSDLLDVIFPIGESQWSRNSPSTARRLIELLESNPEREALLDFLSVHVPRIHGYLNWGGPQIFEKYAFGGLEFDARAPYAGHGLRLTLVRFTRVWSDPFVTDQRGKPRVRDELENLIVSLEALQAAYARDRETQASVRTMLLETFPFDDAPGYRAQLETVTPTLRFFVYAGRRAPIDATAARHNTWSRLLERLGQTITLKTYDYIVDDFLAELL